jgi:hypothetical protein
LKNQTVTAHCVLDDMLYSLLLALLLFSNTGKRTESLLVYKTERVFKTKAMPIDTVPQDSSVSNMLRSKCLRDWPWDPKKLQTPNRAIVSNFWNTSVFENFILLKKRLYRVFCACHDYINVGNWILVYRPLRRFVFW